VNLAFDVTTNGVTTLDAGTGTLTLASSKALSTSGYGLTITADDIDIGGSIATGVGLLHLMTQSKKSIGLGTQSEDMDVTADELQRVQSTGLIVGGEFLNGDIRVGGIDVTEQAGITGITTLLALTDQSRVIFDGHASTFYGLHSFADNGIAINVSLTTHSGPMHLDGDSDNSASTDSYNTIGLEDGITLQARTMLSVEVPSADHTGMMNAQGRLTLQAGSGVTVLDHMTMHANGNVIFPTFANGYQTGNELVVDADMDTVLYQATLDSAGSAMDDAAVHAAFNVRNVGAGILTVAAGKTLHNTDSTMLITAFDIDMSGTLSSGSAAISIHASRTGQSIGLGAYGDMEIADDELSRIMVGGMTTTGDLLFRKADDFEWTANETGAPLELRGAIVVSEVSRDYTVEPDLIIFGRQFSSYAAYSPTPPVSSKYRSAHQVQLETQIYDHPNDFLPLVEGYPIVEVPDIVSLGNTITVTWYPDARSDRVSHEQDWVGLYRKGECADPNTGAVASPPDGLSQPETDFVNQCYVAWESLPSGQTSGTVSFYFESYKVAGEYDVRYFYGDSRDGQGYKCGLQPGTTEYSAHCVLRAKATSGVITVVKSGPAEAMQDVPGIESFMDSDDGSMYVSGF